VWGGGGVWGVCGGGLRTDTPKSPRGTPSLRYGTCCPYQVLLGVCRGVGSALMDLGVWYPDKHVKETGSAEAIPAGYGHRTLRCSVTRCLSALPLDPLDHPARERPVAGAAALVSGSKSCTAPP
jgi:hypothetical protein